jgi:hypothetical protein
MKNIKTILLLIGVLVIGCVFDVAAQRKKAENTSSARAAYGVTGKAKIKKKKKAIKNYTHTKPAQGTNRDGLLVRKKYNKIYTDPS